MSTSSERIGIHEGKRHDGYVPVGVAIMMTCCLISIFLVDAQAGGYAGGSGYPWIVFESAGIIWAGTLVAYFVFIWRSATRGYSYNSW